VLANGPAIAVALLAVVAGDICTSPSGNWLVSMVPRQVLIPKEMPIAPIHLGALRLRGRSNTAFPLAGATRLRCPESRIRV
jgi:hypothetical protein